MYWRNVQLMPTLFLKLMKIWQREHSKFVDFKGKGYLASSRQYGNALLGVRHQEEEENPV